MNYNRSRLLDWIERGAITPDQLERAVEMSGAEPSGQDWLDFAQKTFSWLALIAFACGLVFFFAYNWQDMSRFTKFALVEGALLLSAVLYLRLGHIAALKPAILCAASLLIGALLALVGQTYQTGADPWQLFATWALFMLPLSLLGRSCILWILNAVLFNTALLLYIDLSQSLFGIELGRRQVEGVLCLANTALLIIFELVQQLRPNTLANNQYTQQVLVTFAGVAASFWALENIGSYRTVDGSFALYTLWLAAIVAVYRFWRQDLFVIAAAALSFIIVSTVYSFEAMGGFRHEGQFLLLGLYIIGASSVVTVYLKKCHKREQAAADAAEVNRD
ncbi:MAG: DUF2157 domain-containing protein [Pseudomonadales bacterium]